MSFPKYPAYKDSGVEWLGEVPADWIVLDGRRLFTNIRNRANDEAEQLAATQAYGVMPQKQFMERQDQKVVLALAGTENFKEVLVDDFVISLRSFQGGIEHSSYQGCVSPAYTVLRAKQSGLMFTRFYKYFFKENSYVSALQSVTTGIREGRTITYEQFGLIPLPIPSKIEQVQIAKFLDHETAKIDALIEEQQRLIELLKEKRQAVISQAVTKGLDPSVPMKDSGVKWLGEVPAHWALPKLSYLGQVTNGATPDRENASYWNNGDIPWVASGALNDYHINSVSEFITRDALKSCSVEIISPGAILIGLVGQGKTRGLSALLNIAATINQNVCAIIPVKEKLSSSFLHFYVQCIYQPLRDLGRGSNQAALNCELVSAIRIPLPPNVEQKKIVRYVESILNGLGELEDYAKHTVALMQERRSALISAAVTGKIDVRGWQSANPPLQGLNQENKPCLEDL